MDAWMDVICDRPKNAFDLYCKIEKHKRLVESGERESK